MKKRQGTVHVRKEVKKLFISKRFIASGNSSNNNSSEREREREREKGDSPVSTSSSYYY